MLLETQIETAQNEKLRSAESLLIPKGKNRHAVERYLELSDIDMPDFEGSQLTIVGSGGIRFGLRRDKDIPKIILGSRSGYIGFVGNDVYDELEYEDQLYLEFTPAINTDIRFALASKSPERLESKLDEGAEMVLATSYPNKVRQIASELGFTLEGIIELGGSVESAEEDFEEVDGVVDIVETGDTLKDNGLGIVADNLGKLTIGAVCRREEI